jgi:hypothetical protein
MGTKLLLRNAMMRHLVGRITLIVGAMAVSAALGSAQSIWVGAVTGTKTFNFSPTYFSGELTNLSSPTANQLALYTHTNGDTGLLQWDLILAFVNGSNSSGPVTSPAAPTITSVTGYSNVGNVDGSNNITLSSTHTATATAITPSSSATMTVLNSNGMNQDAYTVLGQPNGQGSPSENWSNYTGVESHIGITATSFTLYEYSLNSFASYLGNYGLLDITFNTTLPQGAIGIGFGCAVTSGCSSSNNRDNSVFTQSGFAASSGGGSTQGTVPEPSSIILMGTVFLAILGIWQRKNKRNFVA